MARVATFGQIGPSLAVGDTVGGVRIGGATAGRYGFDEVNAEQIEIAINAYAGMVGFPKVRQDAKIDATDADRVVRIQRYLVSHFVCNASSRETLLGNLEVALDKAAEWAEDEPITPKPTPEQMWVAWNQDRIIERMMTLGEKIGAGTIKRCAGSSSSPLLFAGAVVGVLWLLFWRK
jgi:hypothetical protein